MTISQRDRASSSHVTEIHPAEHVVQFYESDDFLLDWLTDYVRAGLDAGDTCIVIATQAHRAALEQRLASGDTDLPAIALPKAAYIALDARETLAQFMVDGAPVPERFEETVGSIVACATQTTQAAHATQGRQRVRAFGEMVALLWMENNQAAAIRLEELWNDLLSQYRFSLACGYPMQGFEGEPYAAPFAEVCRQHSRVIPDESYTTLTTTDERLLTISMLQQKAHSLEAEVAERRAAEERLRISENRYRRLFEASTDGILIVDPDTGVVTDANPVIAKLLGSPREQLPGQQLWRIGVFPDREAAADVLRELQRDHVVHRDMLPVRTQDGRARYVEFVANRYRANGHDVIQCNLRDITDRSAFISMASHELKTPVTSLKGFTQILQRRLHQQHADPQTLLFLDRMNAQITKLTGLIGDLLDVSKMETGVLPFRETVIDFDELVRETIENVQAATTTHRLVLEGATHAQVHGDRDRLGQVLVNLLTNAIKYSPKADTVIVRLRSNGAQVEISVRDFGIGIAEQYHERVFERFYQVADRSENTYPGLGIGLYIARTLIERHGGHLWLESREGAGSTFHFALPISGSGRAVGAGSLDAEVEAEAAE